MSYNLRARGKKAVGLTDGFLKSPCSDVLLLDNIVIYLELISVTLVLVMMSLIQSHSKAVERP